MPVPARLRAETDAELELVETATRGWAVRGRGDDADEGAYVGEVRRFLRSLRPYAPASSDAFLANAERDVEVATATAWQRWPENCVDSTGFDWPTRREAETALALIREALDEDRARRAEVSR